mgnify:FL=1
MTVEELHEKYGLDNNITAEALIWRGSKLNPIYEKHLFACWIIETIYGHVANENISLGKARELTASVIEQHLKKFIDKQ